MKYVLLFALMLAGLILAAFGFSPQPFDLEKVRVAAMVMGIAMLTMGMTMIAIDLLGSE